MAQMKEQIKAPEKIQLSNEEIANLSDAEFKTLVIRMPTEMVEYHCKTEEKYAKWNKEKYVGHQQCWKETRNQIEHLEQKEEINIQPEQNEENRNFFLNEERLRDNFKSSNI